MGLIEDIWTISIAYCLFGLYQLLLIWTWAIVNWLFVYVYWIGIEILFGLLIGYLFGLIRLNLRYYFLWPCVLLMWAC